MARERPPIPDNGIECDECGGDGWRLVYGDSSGWMYERQPCEDCNGRGFICLAERDDDLSELEEAA